MNHTMSADSFISEQLNKNIKFIKNIITLIDDGATIPFMARYRKEMTGGMDEIEIGEVCDVYEKFKSLEKRKLAILKSIDDKLTDELESQIKACRDLTQLEDIYLPYKPKRQTRAEKARIKGLEPLAANIIKQTNGQLESLVSKFINDSVETSEDAIKGAKDIIAEWVSENEIARNKIRNIFRGATISSKVVKGKEEEGVKYADYFDFSETLKYCPSHRILALRRGEAEGILRLSLEVDKDRALETLNRIFIKGDNQRANIVLDAIEDAYKRLLSNSISTEYMGSSKENADTQAIDVFANNLRQLLLAPPLGNKRVLAIDPGFRTGCKVVCLDETGALLHNENIYPHPPKNEYKQALSKIANMVATYNIEAIAIGNGTAGRETEHFVQNIHFDRKVQVFVVSEAGASIYSASPIAREEFPDKDITVRGAVSIGRRLMDPLAELVKIDAKSIGVGQYQHDVDQSRLKKALDKTVESCVNNVGVNLNNASPYILSYVSGLGPTLAKNIIEYRKENGKFSSRKDLKKVNRMGEKAFEQCAGFLRIPDASNPLDNSAVHPESYYVVEKIAKDMGVSVSDMIGNEKLCDSIKIDRYIDTRVGKMTLQDIISELKKPGRDPRSNVKVFSFDENVHTINDLEQGMVLPAIITNVTNFGAFADIGVKQDGLIHISQMADKYISNPSEIVSLNQQLMVKVIEVDVARKRISLSMKNL